MTTQALHLLPKIDLHCHLDGSLEVGFIHSIVSQTSYESIENVRKRLQVPMDCASLSDYLTCFDLPVACMQTPQQVRDGAYGLVRALAEENVVYAEVRFAPILFTNNNFSERQSLESTLAGLHLGQVDFGIPVNTIVCALRHFSHEQNSNTFRLARDYKDYGVCAVDLAGNEAAYPTADFTPIFNLAKTLDLPFTIHAGECKSAQSIQEALDFGAKRIGHGIAMSGNAELQAQCAKKRIGIEMCPISNYQTKAVSPNQTYPLEEFLQAGLCATVNTDNRTVSNTSLCKEFSFLQENCNFTQSDILQVTNNAIECAFASDDIKHNLWKQINGSALK